MQAYEIDSIQFHVRDHFSIKEIPANAQGIVCLHPEAEFTFSAVIRHPDKPKKPRELTYQLVLKNSTGLRQLDIPLIPEKLPRSRATLLKGVLSARQLNADLIYNGWKLIIQASRFSETHTLAALPRLALGTHALSLPDMRESEADALYDQWRQSGFPLLLLSGNGGIGKSLLCERICGKAVVGGYSCVELCLSSESDSGFIADLTWAAIGSKMRQVLDGRKHVIDIFVETLQLAAGEESFTTDQLQALASVLARGTLDSAPGEVIIGNLARFMVSKNTPLIFFMSGIRIWRLRK
jgi:hypothetical protein